LPFADASLDVAISIFGRRPAAELLRVLKPGGLFVAVLPGPADLIELRAAAQGEGATRDRSEHAIQELAGLTLNEKTRWEHRAHHDRDTLSDALAMSYRGARTKERERMAGVEALEVTLQADVLVFQR
jgi:23S rRNA (guanine745-N1)-methyltransferase